ncbi:MAG: site-specific integrase [Ignavibacteriales bacterium]|nr:site-specific integrase [Ignavibacteriales bacterium]MCF8438259.1 site-specific integrase [Ignavibacteriales bacterium]
MLQVENYSEQTIENYLSSVKLFLEFIENIRHKAIFILIYSAGLS